GVGRPARAGTRPPFYAGARGPVKEECGHVTHAPTQSVGARTLFPRTLPTHGRSIPSGRHGESMTRPPTHTARELARTRPQRRTNDRFMTERLEVRVLPARLRPGGSSIGRALK